MHFCIIISYYFFTFSEHFSLFLCADFLKYCFLRISLIKKGDKNSAPNRNVPPSRPRLMFLVTPSPPPPLLAGRSVRHYTLHHHSGLLVVGVVVVVVLVLVVVVVVVVDVVDGVLVVVAAAVVVVGATVVVGVGVERVRKQASVGRWAA